MAGLEAASTAALVLAAMFFGLAALATGFRRIWPLPAQPDRTHIPDAATVAHDALTLHAPSPEHTQQIARIEREIADVLPRLEALEGETATGRRTISDLQIHEAKAVLILVINRALRLLVVPPTDERMQSENAQSFETWRKKAENSLQAAQSELRGLERFHDIENCLAKAEAAADRDLAEMSEEHFPKALNPFVYRRFSVARMKCHAFSVYLLRKKENLESLLLNHGP